MPRIAAAGQDGEIAADAENARSFTFFEITGDGRINGMFEESVCGNEEEIITHFLAARNVSVLVCGNIREPLRRKLSESGIFCAEGYGGGVIQAVGDYLMKQISNH